LHVDFNLSGCGSAQARAASTPAGISRNRDPAAHLGHQELYKLARPLRNTSSPFHSNTAAHSWTETSW
jgi:hypothetical protein